MASTRMRCSRLINFPSAQAILGTRSARRMAWIPETATGCEENSGHAVRAKNDAPESPDERRYALA